MSALSEFDRTVQTSEQWIREVADELHLENPRHALQAFRATVTALRDRMRVDDATNLGAQFPLLLAGYFYEGWKPSQTPTKERSSEEFIDRVQKNISNLGHDLVAERVIGAVFHVLSNHISEGAVNSLQSVLPDEFKDLWPAGMT